MSGFTEDLHSALLEPKQENIIVGNAVKLYAQKVQCSFFGMSRFKRLSWWNVLGKTLAGDFREPLSVKVDNIDIDGPVM